MLQNAPRPLNTTKRRVFNKLVEPATSQLMYHLACTEKKERMPLPAPKSITTFPWKSSGFSTWVRASPESAQNQTLVFREPGNSSMVGRGSHTVLQHVLLVGQLGIVLEIALDALVNTCTCPSAVVSPAGQRANPEKEG